LFPPVAFYANVVLSKFRVQKQESIRIQAIEEAIPIAIQTAELLKSKHKINVKKISTRYRLKQGIRGAPSFRVPKIEVILTRPSTDEETNHSESVPSEETS
jgi:DNA-binding protein